MKRKLLLAGDRRPKTKPKQIKLYSSWNLDNCWYTSDRMTDRTIKYARFSFVYRY